MRRPLPAVLAVLMGLGAATGAAAQAAVHRSSSADDAVPAFRTTPAAAAAFRALWAASVAAGQERVACIGGQRGGDGRSLITHVQPVDVEAADSFGAVAAGSIERCGQPDSFGTVHTHIALTGGQRPFANFSANDREVVFRWWRRWQADGTFCVLYSDHAAHCEMDGVAAPRWRREQMETDY
jgi:hypothetical protein